MTRSWPSAARPRIKTWTWVVGVPMVDRHPVELGAEVLLDVLHQLAGEGLEVSELRPVLWRDDEAEVVAISAKTVALAQGSPCLRHDLHEADGALR